MAKEHFHVPHNSLRAVYVNGAYQHRYVERDDGSWSHFEYDPIGHGWEFDATMTYDEVRMDVRDFFRAGYAVNRSNFDTNESTAQWLGI